MESVSTKKFLQTYIVAGALLSVYGIVQTIQRIGEFDIDPWRSKWTILLALFALNILAGLMLPRSKFMERIAAWMDDLGTFPARSLHKITGLVLIALGFASVWVMRLFVFSDKLPQLGPIFWWFLWICMLQSFGLKLINNRIKWHIAFASVFLLQGVIFQAYGRLTIVSSDPFSIGYSEAGRHYFASLFYARSLYGLDLPYPFLHPSRYLLLSLSFLVDGSPLWIHRLWQVILWVGLTSTSAALLARRFGLNRWTTILISAWAFLYFLQGAVYYHLQICVILIMAGVSVQKPWRSLTFIILASAWAGLSRVNWFPVPAMLAITLYVLQTPVLTKGWRYLVTPFIWGVTGLVSALLAQFLYIGISGNADASAFGSSFTSDLLWNRLLPNETYPLGVLPGIIIVTLPLLLSLVQILRGRASLLHPLRWLVLVGFTVVLFVGGAVVSTKIGGGGDLHNMDAYMVLLGMMTLSFFTGQVSVENGAPSSFGKTGWEIVFAAMFIPMVFALPGIRSMHSYDRSMAEQDIQKIQEIVSETLASGGEVLFVTERQLLTFGNVQDVPLVPEYEQVELMEMAMSGNRAYLEEYYADLKSHRFALIVAEKQKSTEKKSGSFLEEDIAWVRYVGAPLLCIYEPINSLSSVNVQFFVPRSQPICTLP
jgi:hypothetical protein